MFLKDGAATYAQYRSASAIVILKLAFVNDHLNVNANLDITEKIVNDALHCRDVLMAFVVIPLSVFA